MALPHSSLSAALEGFGSFLKWHFHQDRFSESVQVVVDTPANAYKSAPTGQHILNVFPYRLAPNAQNAARRSDEPQFLSAHVLLSAFPAKDDANTATAMDDLSVLGHAVRVLASEPVIPRAGTPLPPPLEAHDHARDFRRSDPRFLKYRLQAIPESLPVEELNHIWTMQSADFGFRTSVAYELALIPIEPLTLAEPPALVRSASLDVQPAAAGERPAPDGDVRMMALDRRAVSELPLVLWRTPNGFAHTLTLPAGDDTATLALAGPTDQEVDITITWTRPNGDEAVRQMVHVPVQTHDADSGAAAVSVNLKAPASGAALDAGGALPQAGDQAVVRVQPTRQGGAPVVDAPFAAALTLEIVSGGGA